MGTLLQDIRYGVRILMRFPGVTLAALLALALGTGVNTALFSIVNAVLLAPLPFPDSHELVQVWRTEMPRLQYGSVSYPRYVDWRARNRVFEESGVYGPEVLTLTGGDAPEQISTGRGVFPHARQVMGARSIRSAHAIRWSSRLRPSWSRSPRC